MDPDAARAAHRVVSVRGAPHGAVRLPPERFPANGGRILPHPPAPFLHPEPIWEVASALSYPGQERIIRIYARTKGVQAVILDLRFDYKWKQPLDTIVHGRVVGGIRLYDLTRGAPSCSGF